MSTHNDDLRPSVKNTIIVGGFALHVYAYRKLTQAELRNAGAMWLCKSRRSKYPRSGTVEFFTTIGAND